MCSAENGSRAASPWERMAACSARASGARSFPVVRLLLSLRFRAARLPRAMCFRSLLEVLRFDAIDRRASSRFHRVVARRCPSREPSRGVWTRFSCWCRRLSLSGRSGGAIARIGPMHDRDRRLRRVSCWAPRAHRCCGSRCARAGNGIRRVHLRPGSRCCCVSTSRT